MSAATPARSRLDVLQALESRVLWLAMLVVHHANRVRRTPSGVKVGGHQSSSASLVSIMTALWFHHLRAPDRISVKPHASPVLHAIEYLLGHLDARYLTTLREFGGLQSYPSRLKDPVPADFSTGSVGDRGDGDDMVGARAPLRRRSLRRAAGRAPDRARGRRRAGRGRDLGGARGSGGAAPRRGAVDRGPQPPVARPRRAGHRVRPHRGHVRGGRLARDHREVRPPVGGAVRASRRRRAAPADRRHEERGVPASAVLTGRRAARPSARRRALATRAGAARGRAGGRRAGGGGARPRWPRPRAAARRLRRSGRRDRSAVGGLRLHAEGVAAADARPSGQPLRVAVAAAVGGPRGRAGGRRRRPVGRVRGRLAGGRAVRRGRDTAGAGAAPGGRPSVAPGGAWPRAHREGLDAAGVRALLRRSREQRARGRGARRDGQPRRRLLDQPGRRAEQGRDLERRRADRLVRGRHRHARAMARGRARPARRAGDRRGQPRLPARRAGRRCSTRSAGSAGPAAPPPTSASPRGRSTRRSSGWRTSRPRASNAAARRSPAATRCDAPRGCPRSRSPPSA
jgi:hypothetical protein